MAEEVDHPAHYGGKDNPYEAIKVIEAWQLGFNLGNVIKYLGRPTKGKYLEDLKKAAWYLKREIERIEAEQYKAEIVNKPLTTPSDHVRCMGAWGCVGGYHGRQCPMRKDVP